MLGRSLSLCIFPNGFQFSVKSLLILKRAAVEPIERGVHGEPAAAPERSPLFRRCPGPRGLI